MKTHQRILGALIASVMAIAILPVRAVFGADPVPYNVWIGGKQITSENSGDVLGDSSGSVQYDPVSFTLTLSDPALSKSTHESGAQIYAKDIDLTVKGTAEIDEEDKYAIYVEGGSLTIETENLKATSTDTVIWADNNITFSGKAEATATGAAAVYAKTGDVKVSGGNLSVYGIGIEAGGSIVIDSELIHVEVSTGSALTAGADVCIGSGAKDVFFSSTYGTALVSVPNGKIEISDDVRIWLPEEGKLDDEQKKFLDKDGNETYYSMLVPKKVSVTWETGIGLGTDIVETVDFGEDLYYTDFPSEWTEPEGMHFDGWYHVEEGQYHYCSGGWVPGYSTFSADGDTTMIARYKYWITGWEDTGDNGVYMPFGCSAQERGIRKTGGDVHFDAGENLPIEIDLQKGFVLKDNKVEILSAKTGTVLGEAPATATSFENYTCYTFVYEMPAEDVTLRFATVNQDGVTVTYDPDDDGKSTWTPGSGEDLKLTVHRVPDDDSCIYYLESVTLDGVELVKDTDYTAEAGSAKITIKASVLEALTEGDHEVSVNFTDGKAPISLSVAAKDDGKTKPDDGGTTTTDDGTSTPDGGGTTTTDGETTTTTDGETPTTPDGETTTTTDGETPTTPDGSTTEGDNNETTTDGTSPDTDSNGTTDGENNDATTPDGSTTEGDKNDTATTTDGTTNSGNTDNSKTDSGNSNTGVTGSNQTANNSSNNKKSNANTKVPKTGETGRTMLLAAVSFLAVSGLAVVILLSRKRKPEETEYDDLKYIVKRV